MDAKLLVMKVNNLENRLNDNVKLNNVNAKQLPNDLVELDTKMMIFLIVFWCELWAI